MRMKMSEPFEKLNIEELRNQAKMEMIDEIFDKLITRISDNPGWLRDVYDQLQRKLFNLKIGKDVDMTSLKHKIYSSTATKRKRY